MKKGLFAVAIHLLLVSLTLVLVFTLKLDTFENFPSGLLNWDAYWYHSIAEKGYVYLANRTCNLAFFPLFPAFWKLFGVGLVGISIINLFVFIGAFVALVRFLNLSKHQIFLLLSTGSFIFFALPYSEALFFLAGFLLIYGYDRKNSLVKNSGFFIISLTRAVTTIFIPLIIFTELMTNHGTVKNKLMAILKSVFASLCGMVLSAFLQYVQTGKFLYFLGVQKYWKRNFIWPRLPFTTYIADEIIFLDAIALVIGLIAIYIATKYFIFKIIVPNEKIDLPKSLVFSLGYISIVTLIDVFFTFYDMKSGTNIWSINRHVLCTPFYIVLMNYLFRINYNKSDLTAFFLAICLVFFFTDLTNYFAMSCFYLLFFFQLIFLRLEKHQTFMPLYLLTICLQVFLYVQFINGGWVG